MTQGRVGGKKGLSQPIVVGKFSVVNFVKDENIKLL
jgi:hypothetical protein